MKKKDLGVEMDEVGVVMDEVGGKDGISRGGRLENVIVERWMVEGECGERMGRKTWPEANMGWWWRRWRGDEVVRQNGGLWQRE